VSVTRRSQRVRDLRLGPDAEKVEDPEDARKENGSHAQRRERRGTEARDERGVGDSRQRLRDEGDQDRD
jgi:hypothetical protein